MHSSILLIFSIFLAAGLGAQSDSSGLASLLDRYNIKTTIGLQLWSTYTNNMQVYNPETDTYDRVDNRLNTQLRRTRFILTGQPYRKLEFNVTAALDAVGSDVLAATETGGNNGASPILRLWNVWLKYELTPQTDGLYLVAGYFIPPVGRESSVAALRTNSFEKPWSQNYLRRQLTGTGPGRASGLLLGGQRHLQDDNLHFTYELALQNPVFEAYSGNSTGARFSPLWSGRLSVHFGDPESPRYNLIHKTNYFGQREGVTLSISGATQGETDDFGNNKMIGAEVLYNTAGFHIDGDYHFFRRNTPDGNEETRSSGRTGYLRFGYNLDMAQQRVLEPVLAYWFFDGPGSATGIANAPLTGSFSGADLGIEVGANYYFNPDLKLSLFYVYRSGDEGEGRPQDINNNYFRQAGVGAVQRGSYLGAGCVALF